MTTDKPKFHLARHVTSRRDTTRSTCRAHAFWLCRVCPTARLGTLVSTRSTRRTCRVVSRRDVTSQVEFGLYTVGSCRTRKAQKSAFQAYGRSQLPIKQAKREAAVRCTENKLQPQIRRHHRVSWRRRETAVEFSKRFSTLTRSQQAYVDVLN